MAICNKIIPKYTYPNFPIGKRGKDWALILRYGAYGDNIIASSVLPYLKRDGYKIAYNTTEWGHETLLKNPLIDELWVQKTDEIPNKELDKYWEKIGQGFGKVVQLNQSIEVECVAVQYRDAIAQNDKYGIHLEAKRKKYDINFYENNIKKAGYDPIPPIGGQIYVSNFENSLARDLVNKKAGNKFKVMLAFAGSGTNKAYPWSEYAITYFLNGNPDAYCFTVGDDWTRLLSIDHPRVCNRTGEQSMRATFAMIPYMDAIVSPDTGVLHAAGCFDDVYKIALLSVNTPENLTKHFKNCSDLFALDVSCYPCHTLIYERRGMCQIGVTGASMCLEKIYPHNIVKILNEIYKEKRGDKKWQMETDTNWLRI